MSFKNAHFFSARILLQGFKSVKMRNGSLENTGTQIGHHIGVFIWVTVEINDQTVFRLISLSRLLSHVNLMSN